MSYINRMGYNGSDELYYIYQEYPGFKYDLDSFNFEQVDNHDKIINDVTVENIDEDSLENRTGIEISNNDQDIAVLATLKVDLDEYREYTISQSFSTLTGSDETISRETTFNPNRTTLSSSLLDSERDNENWQDWVDISEEEDTSGEEDTSDGNGDSSEEDSITTQFHEETFGNTNLNELGFEVSGEDFTFSPAYYPQKVTLGKTRDLVREKGICRNEYVKDVGTENREIHVTGYITGDFLRQFHDMCDFGQKANLITMQWQGEVLLDDSELEGPIGIDAQTDYFLYEYTLDFVSTGRDEMGTASTGILNDGG